MSWNITAATKKQII